MTTRKPFLRRHHKKTQTYRIHKDKGCEGREEAMMFRGTDSTRATGATLHRKNAGHRLAQDTQRTNGTTGTR